MKVTESDYRAQAYHALARAETQMGLGDADLRYAVLELRVAIEALVMGRAATFQDEMGEQFLSKWNPRDLLHHLRTIDPKVDRPMSLSVDMGKDGVEDFRKVGDSRPITLEELDRLHHSLGSFLHAATLSQVGKGEWFNAAKARKRCEAAVALVRLALDSTLSAMKFKFFASAFDCERCKSDNHILNLRPGEKRAVTCHKCGAPYAVVGTEDGMRVGAHRLPITCAMTGCGEQQQFFADEIRASSKWTGDGLKALEWTCQHGHFNLITMRNILVDGPQTATAA